MSRDSSWQDYFSDKLKETPKISLRQAFSRDIISESEYQKWASSNYRVPKLDDQYLETEYKLDMKFWNQIKNQGQWDSSYIPLYIWDDILYVACLEPSQNKYSGDKKVISFLASTRALDTLWKQVESYNSMSVEQAKPSSSSKNSINKTNIVLEDGEEEVLNTVQKEEMPKEKKIDTSSNLKRTVLEDDLKVSPIQMDISSKDTVPKDDEKSNPVQVVGFSNISKEKKKPDPKAKLNIKPSSLKGSDLKSKAKLNIKPSSLKGSDLKSKAKLNIKPSSLKGSDLESKEEDFFLEDDNFTYGFKDKLKKLLIQFFTQNFSKNREKSTLDTALANFIKGLFKKFLVASKKKKKNTLKTSKTDKGIEVVSDSFLKGERPMPFNTDFPKSSSAGRTHPISSEKPAPVQEQESVEKKTELTTPLPDEKEVKEPASVEEESTEPDAVTETDEEFVEELEEETSVGIHNLLEKTRKHMDSYILFKTSRRGFKPVQWSDNLSPIKKRFVSTDKPSIFRISLNTKQPYFGHVIQNFENSRFFENWGFQSLPSHATLVPFLSDKGVVLGCYLGITNGSTPPLSLLSKMEDFLNPIEEYFGANKIA